MIDINITSPARQFLLDLLKDQEDVRGVFMTVNNPGTATASTLLSYCRQDLTPKQAIKMTFGDLTLYIDKSNKDYLQETEVDLQNEELVVKSPNSRTPILPENATLEDKISYVLAMSINPMLAAHGGAAQLVEVKEGKEAVITFSGGCQGCAVVPMTMKHMIEKQIKDNVPEIVAVTDITDHSDNTNAFYK